jgi:ATP-dependent Clp protease adaptor protein ClpS
MTYPGKSNPALEQEDLEQSELPVQLVVHNDDVNTFDWVIESLMEICGHSYEQAEQCAMIIHFKGKYAVKKGSHREMNPLRIALTDRGINATIEEL